MLISDYKQFQSLPVCCSSPSPLLLNSASAYFQPVIPVSHRSVFSYSSKLCSSSSLSSHYSPSNYHSHGVFSLDATAINAPCPPSPMSAATACVLSSLSTNNYVPKIGGVLLPKKHLSSYPESSEPYTQFYPLRNGGNSTSPTLLYAKFPYFTLLRNFQLLEKTNNNSTTCGFPPAREEKEGIALNNVNCFFLNSDVNTALVCNKGSSLLKENSKNSNNSHHTRHLVYPQPCVNNANNNTYCVSEIFSKSAKKHIDAEEVLFEKQSEKLKEEQNIEQIEVCNNLLASNDFKAKKKLEINNVVFDMSEGYLQKTVDNKVLNENTLPINVLKCEYAVRGRIVTRSMEIEKIIKDDPTMFPFKELCYANIGNPLAVGQRSITFNRQILSFLIYPDLLNVEGDIYPFDVKQRAEKYLKAMPNFGAYSHSAGIEYFRRECARWFEERDGYPCNYENIFLSDGASTGIFLTLELLIRDQSDGIMIPVPQYPLYSASITRLGGTVVPYYLSEENNWSLSISELVDSLRKARNKGINVRSLVVINPGNPTGAVLLKTQIQQVINFCELEHLVLLADEVYQENIYGDTPFISFRKVLCEMNSKLELISFHSSSKGITGECGIRGGLLQAQNLDKVVLDNLYKLFSISLCPNTVGQAMMICTLTPPQESDPSYLLFKKQKSTILESLKRKAKLVHSHLNSMQGVTCQPISGAMYAFPSISLPPRAIEAAKEKNMVPDLFYCMELLENIGVVVVPGSGFGQKEGTWHFRITILPEEEKLKEIMIKLHDFHHKFMEKYADVSEN